VSGARAARRIGDLSPTLLARDLGIGFAEGTTQVERKLRGQYFTQPAVAQFMASLFTATGSEVSILDPCAGTGVLACAAVEHFAQQPRRPRCIRLVCCENDPRLLRVLATALNSLTILARSRRIKLEVEVRPGDYLLDYQPERGQYSCIIINPPYYKLGRGDPRCQPNPWPATVVPNIYAAFLLKCAAELADGGELVSITPRSFSSGAYFRAFRRVYFSHLRLDRLHLFEDRDDAFSHDDVLQENVIMRCARHPARPDRPIAVSTSKGVGDLGEATAILVAARDIFDVTSNAWMLRLPSSNLQLAAVRTVSALDHTLASLGLQASTGRVVPFRCTSFLSRAASGKTAPLLWMQHVQRGRVTWPLSGFAKPQYIIADQASAPLLIQRSCYVLVRRFSAKEDPWRVVAAPLSSDAIGIAHLGVENHLNVISSADGPLSQERAELLSEYLNSELVDLYLRTLSGHTQVGATELLSLPMPGWEDMRGVTRQQQHAGASSRPRTLRNAARRSRVVGEKNG